MICRRRLGLKITSAPTRSLRSSEPEFDGRDLARSVPPMGRALHYGCRRVDPAKAAPSVNEDA
ncbi:hypothetical protein T4A_13322, partial [Trichinella pseudospiralis]